MSDMTLEKVDIVFENCEVISIPYSHIKYMGVENITSSLYKHFNNDKLDEMLQSDYVKIILSKNANVECDGFPFKNSLTVFERLEWNDITHLDIFYKDYEDGQVKNKYIAVNWDDTNEWKNTYQVTKVDKRGNLTATIGKHINA